MEKTYTVHFSYYTSIDIEVNADNEDEALELAKSEVSDEKYNQHLLDNLDEACDPEVIDVQPITDVEEDGFTTEDAVRQAFPKMTEGAVGIITSWYENDFAIDDFDKLDDYANFIFTDLGNMLNAASNPAEVEIVTVALRKIGYLEEE